MGNRQIKYPIGTKVKICDELKTRIEKVEWNEKSKEHLYWFKDAKGILWYEVETGIEKIE